jgi:hypothetical protein
MLAYIVEERRGRGGAGSVRGDDSAWSGGAEGEMAGAGSYDDVHGPPVHRGLLYFLRKKKNKR